MNYKRKSKKELVKEINRLNEILESNTKSGILTPECYQQILNTTNEGLLVYQLHDDMTAGCIMQSNNTTTKLLGYSQSQLKTKTPFDIIPKGFFNKVAELNKEILHSKNIDYEIILVSKTGDNIPVNVNSKLFSIQNKNWVISVIKDLIEKRRAELRISKDTENSKQLLKLFLNASEMDDKKLFENILNTSIYLTNSTIGFLHKVDNDQKTIILTAWNKEALRNCTAAYDAHYPLNEAGNWVDCIHKKEPVIYNDFPNSPNQKGLPKGHTPIKRFMSIPVFENDKIRYIFGVGNKPENYNEHDVIQIQLIANEFVKIIKKRKAEQALKESEEKFRSIYKNSLVGFYRTSANGKILMANPALINMLGYSSFDELSNITASKKLFDSQYSRPQFKKLIKEKGKVVDFESIWYKKDGTKLYVSESANIFYDENGKIKYYEGTVTDISGRKQTEKALHESEQRYRALFDAASDAIFIMKNDRFINCNQQTLDIFGCTKEQIIHKQPSEFSPETQPDGRGSDEKAKEKINAAFNGNPQIFEWKHKRYDGTLFDAEVSLKRIDLSSEIYIQAIVRDITERKIAEGELKKYKNHLEELVEERTTEANKLLQAIEQSPASVVITNTDGNIIYVNKSFTSITGYSKQESIGQNPRVLKSGFHPNSYYKDLWNTILNGKTWRGEFKNKKKNGEIYWESASISPIITEKDITGFIAVKEDITQKKQLEKELIIAKEAAEKATKVKSEFLANMSHEIRTPMNAVIGFTELLLSMNEDEKQASYLNALHSSSKSLLNLINDILDFSKVEAGKLELNYDNINANDFFSEIEDIFSLKIQHKGLEFKSEISTRLPVEIKIDDLRLRQVLINLINNAIKFTEKGFIKLKVVYSKTKTNQSRGKNKKLGNLTISIQDSGVGISKENREKIFESFTQGNIQTNQKYGGTGLGLAISKQLIELMNGTIEIKSTLNKGSTFIIKLPDIETSNTLTLNKENKQYEFDKVHFKPGTIVIVDDIENNRHYLTEVLKNLGFKVYSAENGELALLLAKNKKPDLIITDLKMPIMDGYQFLEEFRNYNEKIPVIATSASVVINKHLKAKHGRFDDFLAKPILTKELIKTLIKYLPHEKEVFKKKEIKLTGNAIKKLAYVIQKLETDLYKDWKKFEKRKPIKSLQKFGEDLVLLGNKNNNAILTQYANSLIKSIEAYDVGSIQDILRNYEALINKLKNYHEGQKK